MKLKEKHLAFRSFKIKKHFIFLLLIFTECLIVTYIYENACTTFIKANHMLWILHLRDGFLSKLGYLKINKYIYILRTRWCPKWILQHDEKSEIKNFQPSTSWKDYLKYCRVYYVLVHNVHFNDFINTWWFFCWNLRKQNFK